MKQKPEPKSVGPLKDEDFVPWNGVTLNRCLAIAAIAALLSVGFQVLQESADSDDLAEAEDEIWTSPESNDQQSLSQQSEPWFFEGWFGSSTPNLAVVEESEIPETADSDISVEEELEQPVAEELEQTDEEVETKTEPLLEELEEIEKQEEKEEKQEEKKEKQEEKKEKQKPSEQWGLKSKSRYMEAKGMKIQRAAENGSQKREVFPFNLAKKSKDSVKPYLGEKEKPYKDTKYQKKYNERKYDYPKKEFEKSFKKERKEEHKSFKEDKGKKENKEYKAYKQYHSEKDYKKKYEPRHHD